MKRYTLIAIACLSVFTLLAAPPLDAVDTITDEQVETVRTNCTEIRGSITRLRQADTLLRTNRGQLYLRVSDKLMTPLNERIASNQLDGSELLRITAEYKQAYQSFFLAYRDYDLALSEVQSIDCTRQPTTFYDRITDARNKREQLHEANNELIRLARSYQEAFADFKTTFDEERDMRELME